MSTPHDFMPVIIQVIIAAGFVITTLLMAHWLGPRRVSERKNDSFECGIEQASNARTAWSVNYFLVAILFVLFDVEIIFLYPWAASFKALGWFGLMEMLFFLFFVLSGLFYIILKGALKWE